MYSPYKPCIGRKHRRLPKLYRPFAVLINSNLCNHYMLEKNKVKFISQLLRWFYKSRWGYKISLNAKDIKNNYNIINGSNIILCTRTQKAAFKNLLVKLNYKLIDYKILKKRQYVLNFSFLFLDVSNNVDSNISLDIISFHEDKFKVLIVLNGYYIEDFNNIISYYNIFVYNQYYDSNFIKEIYESNFNLFNIKFGLNDLDILDYIIEDKEKKYYWNYNKIKAFDKVENDMVDYINNNIVYMNSIDSRFY
jgi:hypothetical protein